MAAPGKPLTSDMGVPRLTQLSVRLHMHSARQYMQLVALVVLRGPEHSGSRAVG
jgi:hypothetical protein